MVRDLWVPYAAARLPTGIRPGALARFASLPHRGTPFAAGRVAGGGWRSPGGVHVGSRESSVPCPRHRSRHRARQDIIVDRRRPDARARAGPAWVSSARAWRPAEVRSRWSTRLARRAPRRPALHARAGAHRVHRDAAKLLGPATDRPHGTGCAASTCMSPSACLDTEADRGRLAGEQRSSRVRRDTRWGLLTRAGVELHRRARVGCAHQVDTCPGTESYVSKQGSG